MKASFLNNIGLYAAVAVVCVSSFLFLYQLDSKPFWDYDEAIYANVINGTLQNGDIFTLHSAGSPWFEKPPLSFWLSIEADSIFHNPELSYRLTAAIAGIISIILVMLIAYEISGSLFTASLAGLVLLTTGPFLEAGRELRLDVPAVSMILFSIYCFLRGLRSPIWFLGVGIGLGVGFMFKSVIGLLSLPFIFFWSLFNLNFYWLKSLYMWLGGLLFLLILIPWHVYETIKYGSAFWQGYFFHAVLQRFGSDVIGGSASGGDFISFFFVFAAPWTILFIGVIWWLVAQGKRIKTLEVKPIAVFAATAVFLFIVFLLSSTKIVHYLLPVYPYIAIAIALFVGHLYSLYKEIPTAKTVLYIGTIFLFVCAFWVAIYYGFHKFDYIATNDIIVNDEKAVALIIKDNTQNLPIYTYQYDYYDTIEYYSGRSEIRQMSNDQTLSQPFFLVVSTWFMSGHSFSPELQAHLAPLYKGESITLYRFNP